MPPTGDRAAQRDVAARWTPLLAQTGWTPVCDVLLDGCQLLNPPISNLELLLIIHLIRFKWDSAPPFPGFTTVARKMGVTATSVRNHARSLHKKGYLVRIKRPGSSNLFDLTPLFHALEKLFLDRGRKPSRRWRDDDSLGEEDAVVTR